MNITTRNREYVEGRKSRRRTYKCRVCGSPYYVDTQVPLPESQRVHPSCEIKIQEFTLPNGKEVRILTDNFFGNQVGYQRNPGEPWQEFDVRLLEFTPADKLAGKENERMKLCSKCGRKLVSTRVRGGKVITKCKGCGWEVGKEA